MPPSLALTRLALLLLSGHAPTAEAQPAESALQPLLGWIEAHLDQPLQLEQLETVARCSRRCLQYRFRQELNCTPMQWVRERRLNRAKELLKQADPPLSVLSVAQRCGYSNLSAFSRDFRQWSGQRPSELLRGQAGNNAA
jgi:transcriptional regulator GlxA family with amidase domain